jgi:hypothetical protein
VWPKPFSPIPAAEPIRPWQRSLESISARFINTCAAFGYPEVYARIMAERARQLAERHERAVQRAEAHSAAWHRKQAKRRFY